jgi:hypothetical protein
MDPILDKKLLELRAEIAQREAELAALKAKFKTLDDARALLIEMTSAPEGGLAALARLASSPVEKEIGLQESVLQYLTSSPNPGGVSMGEIIAALRLRHAGRYSGKNSFASSVYVTLKRLAEQGKASTVSTPAGKRWLAPDQTRSIFDVEGGK